MTFLSGALRIAVLSLTLTFLAAAFETGIVRVDRFESGVGTLILIPDLGIYVVMLPATGLKLL